MTRAVALVGSIPTTLVNIKMAHEEYCDECNKKIDYLEWTASDDGGYMAFCSEKCGIKYIKENAKDFLCHQD